MVTAANRFHARQAQHFTGLAPEVTSGHVRDLLADLRVPNAKTLHPEKPKPKVALGKRRRSGGTKANLKTARTRRRDGRVN